jgi:LysM repeat protein
MPTVERADSPPAADSTPNAPTTTTNPAGRTTYIVQLGDTLAEIATEFNVTLEDLARANNITDVNRIEVDQELVIP